MYSHLMVFMRIAVNLDHTARLGPGTGKETHPLYLVARFESLNDQCSVSGFTSRKLVHNLVFMMQSIL